MPIAEPMARQAAAVPLDVLRAILLAGDTQGCPRRRSRPQRRLEPSSVGHGSRGPSIASGLASSATLGDLMAVEILPTQHSDLAEAARASAIGADVESDYRETIIWRYRPNPYTFAIVINESERNTGWGPAPGFKVTRSTGTEYHDETVWVAEWQSGTDCLN